jgi:hypothetical protein
MQDNQVFIDEQGIIEIHVIGNQTVESVRAMGEQTITLAKGIRKGGKQALILDNLLQMGSVPPEARRLVVDLVRSSDYDKLAMLGSDTILRLGANLMLQATGRGSHVRYFENEEKCLSWLLAA